MPIIWYNKHVKFIAKLNAKLYAINLLLAVKSRSPINNIDYFNLFADHRNICKHRQVHNWNQNFWNICPSYAYSCIHIYRNKNRFNNNNNRYFSNISFLLNIKENTYALCIPNNNHLYILLNSNNIRISFNWIFKNSFDDTSTNKRSSTFGHSINNNIIGLFYKTVY